MAKRTLLPKTTHPIEAVILGLDTSKHSSGAVLLVPNYEEVEKSNDTWENAFDGTYERVMLGVVKNDEQKLRAEYVKTAIGAREIGEDAECNPRLIPLVVVAEDWTPGGSRMTFDTIKAMGVGWGRWEAEIMRQAPEALIVRYKPAEWRELAFGWRYPKGREAVKLFAMKHIEKAWGFAVSEDVAEAGCIAMAGTRSGEVLAAIQKATGKRKRKKVPSSA